VHNDEHWKKRNRASNITGSGVHLDVLSGIACVLSVKSRGKLTTAAFSDLRGEAEMSDFSLLQRGEKGCRNEGRIKKSSVLHSTTT